MAAAWPLLLPVPHGSTETLVLREAGDMPRRQPSAHTFLCVNAVSRGTCTMRL